LVASGIESLIKPCNTLAGGPASGGALTKFCVPERPEKAAPCDFAAPFAGSQAEAAVVNRIDVEGNQRVDAETIRAYLFIQPGQDFTRQDEDASLKALFETGLFSDVDMDVRGAVLVVIVVENPTINEVAFEGNTTSSAQPSSRRRAVSLHARKCRMT
jgi:hypothetical protein